MTVRVSNSMRNGSHLLESKNLDQADFLRAFCCIFLYDFSSPRLRNGRSRIAILISIQFTNYGAHASVDYCATPSDHQPEYVIPHDLLKRLIIPPSRVFETYSLSSEGRQCEASVIVLVAFSNEYECICHWGLENILEANNMSLVG